MQLYSRTSEGKIISATLAEKKMNYICLECEGLVRVRGGIHRQNHFYHPQSSSSCSQTGKSMVHLQVQCQLQKLISDVELEKPFPEIKRIADVVWESKKIIFEVQCSSIRAEEVADRNRDYGSLGYQVVWILHDHRFNQFRISAAEEYLQDHPHYYTNMDMEGKGVIYDQFHWIQNGIQRVRFEQLKVSLLNVNTLTSLQSHSDWIKRRVSSWPFFFEGDLVSRVMLGENCEYLDRMLEVERGMKRSFWRSYLSRWVVRPYRLFFQLFLEMCCR